jgi:membrane-bound lytic murein transglycosylase B
MPKRGRRSTGRWWRPLIAAGAIALAAGALIAVVAQSSIDAIPDPPVAAPDAASAPATDPAQAALRADPEWTTRVAEATGIAPRALQAYATAALALGRDQPACGIGWNTLAGIGSIESHHGSHGGATLGDDGYSRPEIRGIPLDGTRSARIDDSDGGRWDGDTEWDRAVGPLQFIPDTWERWGADADGDGTADPDQIDDAALTAGRYLCAAGEMTTVDGWRRAIFSYNNLETYVDDVASVADTYAARADGR